MEENIFYKQIFHQMRALEFITGHVTFKLRYNKIYKLKTNMDK